MIHVATLVMKNIDSLGGVVNKETASTKELIATSSEIRVKEDSTMPNTVGFPTIKRYLELEDGDSYQLSHMDQTYIITYSVA